MWMEIRALQELDCWEEVEPTTDLEVLHTKLILRRERNEEGDIEKYIERLVVCGKEERDNNDCFSAVVDYSMIKLLLCLAIQKKWR